MSSNISFLLSLAFVVSMMAYAGDLCRIQTEYATLDSLSISAGKLITRKWGIDSDVINLLESNNAHIISINKEEYVPGEGDSFSFKVWKEFKVFSFEGKMKTISINRSVVLGYRG